MIVSLILGKSNYLYAFEEILGEKIIRCKDKQEALKVLSEAEIIITIGGGEHAIPMDAEMVNAAEKLKWIFCVSAGFEKLPMKELHQKGVLVNNTSGVHAGTISEYVLGGMLAFSHHYNTFMKNQMKSVWYPILPSEDLDGKTICIIGAGKIGGEIGKKAKAFDMNVIGIKKHPETLPNFDQVVGTDKLPEVLEISDYVVLVTPLTDETYHLMGKDEFDKMKESAVFINVSRGDTVDEEALVSCLQGNQIRGAVLDVFHSEPLPKDNPLWNLDNVILTPHSAGISKNTTRKIIALFKENVNRYKNHQILINQI
ncbi:MAG: D-isomer specific 2-hydroxyacid dehydrogenase NAD-binding [Anaerocolumna sp.]|jgi:phosphoglycerate dehydrogenase-like enzyme|nr:D-isomer specific 2-hydroxyacid dehydrogenase NAD-binding [Anaerocolumna sp.]